MLDMFSEELFHFFVAVGGGVLDGCGELRENGCKFGHGVFQAVAGDEDFFVATGVGAFFRRQDLFEEFFTGAQAGKLNVG
ncbi:MAG: hypothetical protein COS57_05325 [Syntrophobacterales bacterium CG03_land_8_20_14_0_80_58_14]|nr:MAG: hypothetical protein COS57_05325 [Syntrophobacterales bacterium CG03_land_8_20_14_0_80_58_14]